MISFLILDFLLCNIMIEACSTLLYLIRNKQYTCCLVAVCKRLEARDANEALREAQERVKVLQEEVRDSPPRRLTQCPELVNKAHGVCGAACEQGHEPCHLRFSHVRPCLPHNLVGVPSIDRRRGGTITG